MITFRAVTLHGVSISGTKSAGQALTPPRATRGKSPTLFVSRAHVPATTLSYLAFLLSFCSPALAQSQPVDQMPRDFNLPYASKPSLDGAAPPQQRTFGTVSGRIVDQTGNGVAGADVKLWHDQESLSQTVQSDDDGNFAFGLISPGPLQFTIVAEGFVTQTFSCTVRSGESCFFPQITLSLATLNTEIHVSPPREEIAQEQLKDQERQRVFGIIPNFYVSYVSEAAPLTSKQKFQLALKTTTDPVTFASVGVIAGISQAANRFSGYGQGAQGYAKRYAASYANVASGLFIGGAVLPSLLKQDPRYFYKGTGTKRSRFLYAVSRTVTCKGDNQRWQPNYSSILGDLAAGGISNLYIPEQDRHGARLTFENAGISIATTAALNVLQEFVLHKITSKRR